MGIRGNIRRDPKRRILRAGESIRADGKYQFKYYVDGKPHFVYSWKLEPTDTLPQGKKPCLSLREMEKQIGYDLDAMLDPQKKNMTVMELVERYLRTRTAVKPQTKTNYNFVVMTFSLRTPSASSLPVWSSTTARPEKLLRKTRCANSCDSYTMITPTANTTKRYSFCSIPGCAFQNSAV